MGLPHPPRPPGPLHSRMASPTGELAGRPAAERVAGAAAGSSCFPPPPLRHPEQRWMLLGRPVPTARVESTLSPVPPSPRRGARRPGAPLLSAAQARGSVWGTTWCLHPTSSPVPVYRRVAGEAPATHPRGGRADTEEDAEDITVMRMEGGGQAEEEEAAAAATLE